MTSSHRRLLRDLRALVVDEREGMIDNYLPPRFRDKLKADGRLPKVNDFADPPHTRRLRADYRHLCRLIERIDEALAS